jgi:hypothetical protein
MTTSRERSEAWKSGRKSRGAEGFGSARAKLTPQQRDEIADRLDEGETPMSLATEYGVTASAVRTYRRR